MSLLKEDILKKAGLEDLRSLNAIAELPYIKTIFLFGSRAKGNYRKWSDIDLAIDYDSDDDFHRNVVNTIISQLSDAHQNIDIIDYNSKLSDEFRNVIDRDKVILYEK